jgi:hypothetical protein
VEVRTWVVDAVVAVVVAVGVGKCAFVPDSESDVVERDEDLQLVVEVGSVWRCLNRERKL